MLVNKCEGVGGINKWSRLTGQRRLHVADLEILRVACSKQRQLKVATMYYVSGPENEKHEPGGIQGGLHLRKEMRNLGGWAGD